MVAAAVGDAVGTEVETKVESVGVVVAAAAVGASCAAPVLEYSPVPFVSSVVDCCDTACLHRGRSAVLALFAQEGVAPMAQAHQSAA